MILDSLRPLSGRRSSRRIGHRENGTLRQVRTGIDHGNIAAKLSNCFANRESDASSATSDKYIAAFEAHTVCHIDIAEILPVSAGD